MNPEDTRLLVLALSGAAVAISGWIYSRRLGVAAVQKTLTETQRELIGAMNMQLALRDIRLEDVERRLKHCEKREAAEKRARIAAKRCSELIG